MKKTSPQERVQIGFITAAHGIRGQVKVKSFTENPTDLTAYGPLYTDAGAAIPLTITGQAKQLLIGTIENVSDRTEAERYINTPLFIPREALPAPTEGDYYHADLISLEARLQNNTPYGTIIAIHNFGAGDILEILTPDNKTEMLPFNKDTIPEIHVNEGYLYITPPDIITVKEQ